MKTKLWLKPYWVFSITLSKTRVKRVESCSKSQRNTAESAKVRFRTGSEWIIYQKSEKENWKTRALENPCLINHNKRDWVVSCETDTCSYKLSRIWIDIDFGIHWTMSSLSICTWIETYLKDFDGVGHLIQRGQIKKKLVYLQESKTL